MKILIIKMSSMGDIIHTLPAITDAARAIPDIQMDWVVEENFSEIPAWHPAIRRVIPVAIRRWRKEIFPPWKMRGHSKQWSDFKQALQKEQYDCVIDAQGLFKSAIVARMANGPVYGFDFRSAREPLATFLYQHKFPVAWNQHAVERTRRLFAQALCYTMPGEDKSCSVQSFFQHSLGNGDFGLLREQFGQVNKEKPYVLFLHGTTRGAKHWPDEHWMQLCKTITDAGFYVKVPWFNAEENARAEKIAAVSPRAEVRPRSDLSGMAKTLAEASAFVAVDTGLGHLGAAFNVPGISLYGPTSPARIGAYGENQIHIGAKALSEEGQKQPEDFLSSIPPEAVWRELQKILHK